MNRNEISRLLKQYWRSPGNARLKGLFLAASDTNSARPEDVGRAWPTDPDERRRLAEAAAPGEGRMLSTPVSQRYAPGTRDDFGSQNEHAIARSLSKALLSGEDDRERFLAGDTPVDKDTYIQRALLNESVTELDVLFREELRQSLIMGAQPRKIFRDAANVMNVSKRKGDIPRHTDEVYAEVSGQGDVIGTGREGFDTVAFECEKVAQGFEISDELLDESEPDVMEALARQTGAAVENTVNRICLVQLVDNAGQTFDADVGGTVDATAVQALNGAATNVDLQDFGPTDTAVVHPEFEQDLFDDTNVVYANRGGSTEPLQDRQLGSIMGHERFMASDGTYNNAGNTRTLSPSNTWGYAADGEYGAVAYQREMFNLIVYDEFDMETKEYEDPIRDLQGMNVRTYVDAKYGQTNAASVVQY
jgi:hypothetical protein